MNDLHPAEQALWLVVLAGFYALVLYGFLLGL